MTRSKVLAIFFLFFLFDATVSFGAETRQAATVEAALSGDTVRLKGGKTLKYISVDAYSPDSTLPLNREYGQKAQEFNQKLVAGRTIGVEWGPKLRDKQGRLLGYVYLEDGTFINEELLREGWAKARIVVPNTSHAEDFRKWEMGARRDKKGIWEKEPDDPINQYVGEKNTKIYYFPDSPELEKIPEAQLVYFNSRVDAKAAGYRACFTCRQNGALEESE